MSKVAENFRIEIILEQHTGTSFNWIERFGFFAKSIPELRAAIVKCFNELENYITYKIEGKLQPQTLADIKPK